MGSLGYGYSSASVTLVCDFTLSGAPAPATCDGKTVNSTTYQAGGIPQYCTVYAGGSNLTFVTDGIKVVADVKDSYQSFQFQPTLHAAYWVSSSGGTITPKFTIKFNGGTSQAYHEKTDSVPCR